MNRAEAKLIAEELYKLIRNDLKKAIRKAAIADSEERMDADQAAAFLGWGKRTLYNRIKEVPHVKKGRSLIFIKSALVEFLERK